MKAHRVLSAAVTALCLWAIFAAADVPPFVNFQGTLTDTMGNPANGIYVMEFMFFRVPEFGVPAWAEPHPIVEVIDGLFRVALGSTSPFPDGFFNDPDLWLEIIINGEILVPRTQAVSVPFGIKTASADFAMESMYSVQSGQAEHATYSDTAQFALTSSPDDDWSFSGPNIYRTMGNVGIGTTTPNRLLHLYGASNPRILVEAPSDQAPELNLRRGSLYHSMYVNSANDLVFWQAEDRVTFTDDGKVGIGTINPNAPLQVGNGTLPPVYYNTAMQISFDDTDSHYIEFRNDVGSTLWYVDYNGDAKFGSYSHATHLIAGGAIGMTVRVDGSTRNVGIGTIYPSQKLHVYGDINPRILVEAPSDQAPELNLKRGTTTHALYVNSNDGLTFYRGGDRVTISSIGYVGIGTTSPQEALHVNGEIYLTSMEPTTGGVEVRWGANNRLCQVLSSRKYKDNIRPLKDDFDKILDAEPVSFTDKASGEHNIGFIAEDFEKIGLQNLVIHRDGQPESIKYELVSLYLLEIIKQQNAKIDELTQRVAAIETNR